MATPESVGDLTEFEITVIPPDSAPAAVLTDAVVMVRHPDGTEDVAVAMTNVTPNVWRYTATDPIDVDGYWSYRWHVTGGGIDDWGEITIFIPPSAFAVPIPAP